MSGFNRHRGTFSLTYTQARHWWGRARGGDAFPGLGAVASFLADAGFEVLEVRDRYVVLRARGPGIVRAVYAAMAGR